MAKISLYPHRNYWWAPVWDCYPCLLLNFFASIIQCFENMQLTTKSFLNFTSVSLRHANVKEQVLLEVAFLVLAYAPYFQRRCSTCTVSSRAQRKGNQQPGCWGHAPPGKWCWWTNSILVSFHVKLWFYSKCSLNYWVIQICLPQKLFTFHL